jgi:hypothetical protein
MLFELPYLLEIEQMEMQRLQALDSSEICESNHIINGVSNFPWIVRAIIVMAGILLVIVILRIMSSHS